MSNGLSTKNLGLVFGGLVIVAALIFLLDSGKERSFRDTLVDIDTSAVSEILLYPKSLKGEQVRLFKKDNNWMVELNENKSVHSPESKIKNMFSQLLALKPKRLAAKTSKKWDEFQVSDSTGTRVIVKEGGDETLNLIIGKFSFQQPRSMNTYVRLDEDEEVYIVDGFLDMTFNQKHDSFRDGKLIKDKQENWVKLQFNYPADSSFTMNKLDSKWYSDGNELDSVKVTKYLASLSNLTSNSFVNNPDESILSSSKMKLSITANDGRVINVEAFGDTSYVIQSSMNEDSYFDGSKNDFWKKIFKGINSLKK